MARPVWVNLFRECERLSSRTLTLEKPLEMYSSEELERVVLVWESTQIGWRTRDGIPSRQRTIKVEDVRHTRSICWSEYYRHVYLVPGGRWLLVFQTEGEISYYDLESPHYKKKEVMVHDYIRPANYNIVFFAVDISGSLPGESFQLAQYIREDPDASEGIIYRAIKIWNIAPVLEGKVVIGLHAVCLKTIPVDLEVFDGKLSMSLSARHLAFGVSPDELVQYICVVEWPLVVDGSLDYSRRILYTSVDAREFHLLTNDRLAVFVSPNLSVYDYSSLEYINHIPQPHDDLEHTPPSTHCTLCRGTKILSGPYVARGCVHFVAVSHALMQSVTIVDDFGAPGSSTIELFARNLIAVPPHMYLRPWTARYSLGRRHGILFQYDDNPALGNLILLEYDPEQELAPDYLPVVKVIPCGWVIPRSKEDISDEGAVPLPPKWHYELPFRNLLFDEGSGRAVVPFHQRFEVLDFALVYK